MIFPFTEPTPLNRLLWQAIQAKASGSLTENTVTGNPAAFTTDVAKALTGLTIPFTPIQSGSGDPSPTNVRAISGFTGVNVYRTGKNLLQNKTAVRGGNSIYIGQSKENEYPVYLVSGGKYALSFDSDYSTTPFLYIQQNGGSATSVGYGNPITFTASASGFYRMYIYSSGGITYVKDFQLEVGEEATNYSDYVEPATFPVSFPSGQTIYGGTLDAVSGVLTVTHILASTTWGTASGKSEPVAETGLASAYVDFPVDVEQCVSQSDYGTKTLCNLCNTIYWGNATYSPAHYYINTQNRVWMAFSADMDADTQIQFIGQLKTPQTIQLDPVTIQTLIGNNTVWTDTNGSNTVVFFDKTQHQAEP